MIIDFHAAGDRARLYNILDAETGENLNHMRIFYADDETGVIRRYLTRDGTKYLIAEGGALIPAWEEVQRPIRIELKGRVPADAPIR